MYLFQTSHKSRKVNLDGQITKSTIKLMCLSIPNIYTPHTMMACITNPHATLIGNSENQFFYHINQTANKLDDIPIRKPSIIIDNATLIIILPILLIFLLHPTLLLI